MPDNPRSPGHPSDSPSSRSSEGGPVSKDQKGPPGTNTPTSPFTTSSGGGHQTRNIIIGAVATIIASTTVYYLTQYINNRKSSEPPSTLQLKKEATLHAWKRYVIMDSIYYKSLNVLNNDKTLLSNPDIFIKEIFKESATFRKDAAEITTEKDVDVAFKIMLNRRIERQVEFEEATTQLFDNLKKIVATTKDSAEKKRLIKPVTQDFANRMSRMYQQAATEIEDLTKTLTETYGIPFRPEEIVSYSEYKGGVGGSFFQIREK